MKLKDDQVTVICYGKEEIWDSRYEAIDFYTDAMYGSAGSERDRYVNILGDLECGFDIAYDSDSDIPKEEQDRRLALYDQWIADGVFNEGMDILAGDLSSGSSRIVYEDENILVAETGRDYDFVAYVENKTDDNIKITFTGEPHEELEPIELGGKDWIGFYYSDWFDDQMDEDLIYLPAFEEGEFNVEKVSSL